MCHLTRYSPAQCIRRRCQSPPLSLLHLLCNAIPPLQLELAVLLPIDRRRRPPYSKLDGQIFVQLGASCNIFGRRQSTVDDGTGRDGKGMDGRMGGSFRIKMDCFPLDPRTLLASPLSPLLGWALARLCESR